MSPTRPIVLTLATALLAMAPAACGPATPGERPAAAPSAPVSVGLGRVLVTEAIRTVDVTGSLSGDIETTVASKLAGRIESLRADLGDELGTGETLGQIDRRDYELELLQRESAVRATLAQLGLAALPDDSFDASTVPSVRRRRSEADNAKAKFDRARQLFEQSPPLIAEQDLADLRTGWEVARDTAEAELLAARSLVVKARSETSAVDIARQRLADTAVVVPAGFSGAPARFRVAERLVAAGEFMTEGKPMFRLVSVNPIRFRTGVPERFSADLHVGQRAALGIEGNEAGAAGEVARIAPRIDERSRSFEVEIVIPNADGRLKPGAFARASIEIRRDPNVTFVPTAAVITFAGVDRVFTVADGKAVAHRVRLGQRQVIGGAAMTEILGGLEATEVVVTGGASLSDKAPVAVVAAP